MSDSNNRIQDNLSLTAIRVISILKMLSFGPHSEKELNIKLKDSLDVSRSLSKESIWLYISTLKAIGCKITRPGKMNNFKYELKDHPFKLLLTEQELKVLLKLRKYLPDFSSWEDCCIYDKIFAKISTFLPDETIKNYTKELKFTTRHIDYTKYELQIQQLQQLCSTNSYCIVCYKSQSGNVSEFRLLAEKLNYENGALYFWGYNIDLDESQYLRVDRIIGIEEKFKDFDIKLKEPQKVVFALYGIISDNYQAMEGEKIISTNQNSIIIEATFKNRFNFLQKILSFGKDCEIIEPEELKKDIIRKYQLMAKIYNKS